MQFKRQPKNEDQINLTPLIDVVFLLLIFFMVSTTFTKETHLTIDLPEAQGEPSQDQPKQLEILVNADGSYAVNDQPLLNNTLETLKKALQTTAGDSRDLPLVITADANSTHQSVVRAMDAAGQLGFVHLSMTTKNPQAAGK